MSIFGIRKIVTDQEGLIKASSKKKYCVEVIGDAITCGYGIDTDINDDTFCTSTENVTKAYAYHIFQALDIDYSIVALSGYGVISGYTENGLINSFEVLPQYYDKIGFSYASPFGTLKLQDVDWDFSKFVPHVIILNLGTSDESYCKDETEKHNQFKKGYIDLLKKIRYHNDNATILCTLGIMNQGLVETMKSAVIDYTNTTNDYDVVYRILEEQKPYDGYVIDGHPSTITHKKVAKVLEKEIQGYLKYISRETPIGSN